jgi:hypothetical protein
MLSQIRADQAALFSKIAEVNRDFFALTATINSSGGPSGRTFDLSALTYPLERILKVTLADGRELNQVDPLDVDGELAPRYTVRGFTLTELNAEWGPTGSVSASLMYVRGPVDIDPNGSLAQQVSIPDKWTDLLVVSLAQYICHADVGRDPAEETRLQSRHDDRMGDFFNYLSHLGGVESRRFVYPTPTGSKN